MAGSNKNYFSLTFPDAYVALGWGILLASRFIPFSLIDGLYPCTFRVITQVPCFGCGFTRAFFRAANLDFQGAILVSPLGTALFIGVLGFSVFGVFRLIFQIPWPELKSPVFWRISAFVLCAAFAANWIYILYRHFVLGDWS